MKPKQKITTGDVIAAQRGLKMLGMSIEELDQLIAQHQWYGEFASKVIVQGAQQIRAAKLRMGAQRA